MRIGIVGINHKLADLKLREQLAEACQRRFAPALWCNNYPSILLSTCNRTEVYFCTQDLAETHSQFLHILRQEVNEDFEQKLYSYFGPQCFFHLAQVTAGLDSAVIGETEIQGQVKKAYEGACQKVLPKELHFLFQKSLKIGKQIRSVLNMGQDLPDITHCLWKVGNHFFADLKNQRVLFIGASEINRKMVRFLKRKGLSSLYLCNRSLERGQDFAAKETVSLCGWDEIHHWNQYDWIIFGTKSPHYLLNEENIPIYLSHRKLITDLSVPRNVHPKIARNPLITLLNIDQIQRMGKYRTRRMEHQLQLAIKFIELEVEKLLRIWMKKNGISHLHVAQEA